MSALPFSASGPSPVSIKDIARAAGVHYSTVSLALRNHARIPVATRARIQRFAAQLGYQRNPVQFALTARRSPPAASPPRPRLTFLTNRASPEAFANTAHMRSFLAGARRRAEALGYSCELLLTGDASVTPAAVEAQLHASATAGLILGAFMPHLRRIELDWTRWAVVKIDSAFMPPAAPLISNDQMQITRLAFQRLHRLGYRRIGMAVGRDDEENTHDLFTAGCLLEQERLQLSPLPPLYFAADADHAAAAPPLARWAKLHRPDAIVSNWATIRELLAAAAVRTACACLCLNEPDPALAGVVQNHDLVGQKAAETLALLIQSGQRGVPAHPSATYVEGVWRDAPSAPPRNLRP